MQEKESFYFKNDTEWRNWLSKNHSTSEGIYLIFYKVSNKEASMGWEEAVKVVLSYGWIDATVKSMGNGKRRQYFCKRNPKSVWSALNKKYIRELASKNLLHQSGIDSINIGKQNGAWTALDTVEKRVIPEDLQIEFDLNKTAFDNYNCFAPSYRKSYLYWLNQAKREVTRKNRITEIIRLCSKNIKSRNTW